MIQIVSWDRITSIKGVISLMNYKKIIAGTVATILTYTALGTYQPLTTYACSSVEECQTQLEQLQAENERAQQQLNASQSIFTSAQERVEQAQALLTNIEIEIQAYESTITSLDNQITTLETQIVELEASIEEKQMTLRARLADMQLRTKTNQLLDFIVNSESLSDFISRAQSIQQLNAYDNELIQQIEADQALIEEHKQAIEATKTQTQELKAQAQERQSAQADVLATLQSERQALAQEVYGAQGAIDTLNLSEADIQAQLEILQNYVEPSIDSDSGSSTVPEASGFYRPTTGPVTLPYMSTEYPYSSSRPHLGVDIGASEGTPVVSVTDGVVIQATYGYNGGYGNMVVISHNVNGTPMVSIYGHLSSISVSAGQTVSGGQNVGAVGNTGDSFGAHLHIELLSGINYMPADRNTRQQYTVNPAAYF